MGHTNISYNGDNSDRRALNDLCKWYGFKASLLIFRSVKSARTYADLDSIDFSLSFSGCQGHPVRRLFARFHGERGLQGWIAAPNHSPEFIGY